MVVSSEEINKKRNQKRAHIKFYFEMKISFN